MHTSLKDHDLDSKYAEICLKHGYFLVNKCGEGSYASVHLAEVTEEAHKRNRSLKDMMKQLRAKMVAIKILDLSCSPTKHKIRANTEWSIMRKLSEHPHPNVVALLDYFWSADILCLVQEYAGISLLRCIQEYIFSENMAKLFFRQIVNGVKCLHDSGIAHRDLKLENMILGDNGQLKLCDFGLACQFIPGGNDVTTGKCGTAHYAAPEVKSSETYAYRSKPADIWSLGAVLYVLCHRRKLSNRRRGECIQQHLELSLRLSDDCCDLIRRLLRCHPLERLTVEDILHHQWMICESRDSDLGSEDGSSVTIRRRSEVKRSSRRFWALPCSLHGVSASNRTMSNFGSNHPQPVSSIHSLKKLISELPRIGYHTKPQTAPAEAKREVITPVVPAEQPVYLPPAKTIYRALHRTTSKEVAKKVSSAKLKKSEASFFPKKESISPRKPSAKKRSKTPRVSRVSSMVTKQGKIIQSRDWPVENFESKHAIVEKKHALPKYLSECNTGVKNGVREANTVTYGGKYTVPTPPPTSRKNTISKNVRPGLRNYLLNGEKKSNVKRQIAWQEKSEKDSIHGGKSTKNERGNGLNTDNSQNWTREVLRSNISTSKTELGRVKQLARELEKRRSNVNTAPEHVTRGVVTSQKHDRHSDDFAIPPRPPCNSPESLSSLELAGKAKNPDIAGLLKGRLSRRKSSKTLKTKHVVKRRKSRVKVKHSSSGDSVSVYSDRFKRSAMAQNHSSVSCVASSSGSMTTMKPAPPVVTSGIEKKRLLERRNHNVRNFQDYITEKVKNKHESLKNEK